MKTIIEIVVLRTVFSPIVCNGSFEDLMYGMAQSIYINFYFYRLMKQIQILLYYTHTSLALLKVQAK